MNFIPKIEYIELNTLEPIVILLDSPPEGDPFNEEIKVNSKVTKSNNGTRQTQFNYLERKYSLEFIFQSELVKAAIDRFLAKHALRGGKFNYFPSNDEVDFFEYTLAQKGIKYKRPIPSGVAGEFEYDFSLSLERVDNV
jgi:hypothetical protein